MLQSSMEDLPKLPSFMERSRRFGSIGWGVSRDSSLNQPNHNQSAELTPKIINSTFELNKSVDLDTFNKRMSIGSNKIICK